MKKKLIVILGPTAVGKSDLSIEIAKYFNAPIVSSDSRQVYKQMNIGTAVPSAEQLSQVKHYFIQTKDISERFTAGMFELEALETLSEIYKHTDYAVLTGGSGLYIDALCDGFDNVPDEDSSVRKSLQELYERDGIEALTSRLKDLDNEYYSQVDLSNPQRVMRGLEVCISTGKPYSEFRKGQSKQRDFDIIKIGLNIEREILYDRINRRVDIMINEGLVEEAKSLYPFREYNALQTVGYKEFFDYFDGKTTLEEAIELLKRNTRRYAKRQLTWFRRTENVKWFEPSEFAEIINHIIVFR